MSDVQHQPQTGTPRVPQQRGVQPESVEPTAWAGWVAFGAMMMVLLGTFQAVAGLVALFNKTYYAVASSGLVVSVNYTAWGWVHLVVGIAALVGGVGLFTGAMWARILGVTVAGISALVNLGFVNAAPLWALTMITIDIVVIYAITVHGKELQRA